jgi:hypothetical protein
VIQNSLSRAPVMAAPTGVREAQAEGPA